MLEITNVQLSKNNVLTGEKFKIFVTIEEKFDYPFDYQPLCTRQGSLDYPFDYPFDL